VSEQISTAGKEASGTGNMKFAMNGALTIGTLDGANIEIREAVGAENIFIFGLTAEMIEDIQANGGYQSFEYYQADPRLRRVLDELASDRFCANEPGLFRWIRDMLLGRDDYFLLADFGSYVDTQAEIAREFVQPEVWARKAILNIARIGRFSSDRTVAEYAREIWHLTAS
jgi:glycogen phosphorylase